MSNVQKIHVIGLIGGIGSGKSRVAAQFRREGALVIVGDKLGHEALHQDDIKAQLQSQWGNDILAETGEVSRAKLAQIVFADVDQLRKLEEIVFPYITRRITEEVTRAQSEGNFHVIVLDAAVLLESGWDSHCDWIVYVHCPANIRWQRIQQSRNWTKEQLDQRTNAQLSLTEKVTRAHFVIDNSGDVDDLTPQVRSLLNRIEHAQPEPNPTS